MKALSSRMGSFVLGAACTVVVTALVLPGEVKAVAAALVQVVNTMANPVPTRAADNPAFRAWGTRVFAGPSTPQTFTVPADKYLVIDSATGFTNSPQGYEFSINFVNGGRGQAKVLPIEISQKGAWFYTRADSVHVVADPGTTVTFISNSTAFPDSGGYNLDVSGYFVDKP